MVIKEIASLWLMQIGGRYKVKMDKVMAGNWVLIDGIDASINKTATIGHAEFNKLDIFKPIDFNTESVVKLAIEPLNPSELPKMLDSLRRCSRTYPALETRVE